MRLMNKIYLVGLITGVMTYAVCSDKANDTDQDPNPQSSIIGTCKLISGTIIPEGERP